METEIHINLTEDFLDENDIIYDGDLAQTKGLYAPSLRKTYINLSAVNWKSYLETSEDSFIEAFTNTLTHETTHFLIRELCNDSYTPMGDEMVSQILAQQR
jgi:hypothetical protein